MKKPMKKKSLPLSTQKGSLKGYTKTMKTAQVCIPLSYDTPVGVFEKEQRVSLNVPANTKLGDYIKKLGFPSLADMMR
jgi:hypothetical protein